MDMEVDAEEEEKVVGGLQRRRGGGKPRKGKEEEDVVAASGAGEDVIVNESRPGRNSVVPDVEGQAGAGVSEVEEDGHPENRDEEHGEEVVVQAEVIMQGAAEKTFWDFSDVRGLSEDEEQDKVTNHSHSNGIVGMGGDAIILVEADKEETLEDDNTEETDYDIKNVLEKQNTHDLFCPNCKSCITRRVILFQKRRKVQNRRYGLKVDKVDTESVDTEEDRDLSVTTADLNEDQTSGSNEEREVFRCLSCFSIIIRTGDGPKLLWKFGGKKLSRDVQVSPQESPAAQTNVFLDFFRKWMAKDQGIADAVEKTKSGSSTAEEEAPQTGTQTSPAAPQVTETVQSRELDIIKSIVYGGLIESITSLGVVSSAAGGGASTLNTLALALANVFGGLFVIVPNLRELKNKQPSTTATGETPDRYTELLGNRRHFLLHTMIVILSFIVFGGVAPVTYAFSFRKSDSRDYKLAAVAGASLFCILLLAMGKAHVRRPPKSYLKTISYYLILGVMASGISFLFGELFDYLLQKLGWFSSTSSVSGPLLIVVPTEYRSASY